jgi:putative membrane-bound dehydrogenase-like protein
MPARPYFLILYLALASRAFAQTIGDTYDKPGEVQRSLVPKELIPPAPALTPEQERQSFQVAPGFRIELVAAEPLVREPVAMQFGPDGRLWVVEMRNYMPDIDGMGCDEPIATVAILDDADGDGRMDTRTVFQDGLIMPRALMLAGDGALIGAPPYLWHCRDKDGDGRAEEKLLLADDFGVQVDPRHVERASSDLAPNSLTWALDNWVYAAAYTKRFRFSQGRWTSAPTTYRGQFGFTLDDAGRHFFNSASDQLRADILPAHYLGRNPALHAAQGANVRVASDQRVWPARVTPGINRGYRPEMLREGRLKEFTAACAPWLYRASLFGAEFYGNAFVCEPAAHLIKRNVLTARDGSIFAREAYERREFLASTDERFRPVNLTTGPDGALYIADLYRGVLESRLYQTSYLREQIRERGLAAPIGLGRIWRIVPEEKSARTAPPALHRETTAQLRERLAHPDAWWRMTAQRLLVERGDSAGVADLEKMAVSAGSPPLGRLHALWTLEGLGALRLGTVLSALCDADERVRLSAVRLSEPFLRGEERAEVLAALLTRTNDGAPSVRQQLVLTLGEAADAGADLAMAELVRAHSATAFLPDAALSGLGGRELPLLQRLAGIPAWGLAQEPATTFIRRAARCVMASRRAGEVAALLELAAGEKTPAWFRAAILDGIHDTRSSTTKKRVRLASEPAALASLRALDARRHAAIAPLLTWPGQPGAPPEPDVPPLTPVQRAQFEQGRALYTAVCAACHQPHGHGFAGLAPPLADSEWVLGSEQRLARIVLHGVGGPLTVLDMQWRLDMPALGALGDEAIAAILTYLRREWGHGAPPVSPETVGAIREGTKGRTSAWTEAELLKIP